MTLGIDFKEVRQRAFRSYVQDGLLEIWMGVWFALFLGWVLASVLSDSGAFWIVLTVLWVSSFQQAKKRVTYPRIGRVSIEVVSKEVGMGLVVMLILLLISVVLFLLLGYAGSPVRAVAENITVVMGLFLAGLFGYMAFRFGITRYYAYAILSLIAGFLALAISFEPLTNELEIRWAIYAVIMAVVLVPSGLFLLIRFLRDNPVLQEEALDGASEGDPAPTSLSS
jgi:hypothetical protein